MIERQFFPKKGIKKMKKILCVLLVCAVALTTVLATGFANNPKEEVTAGLLTKSEVLELFETEKLTGSSKLTRAQFATMLCMAFEVSGQSGEITFNDVDKSHPAYQSIEKAVSAGWLSGYTNGNFGPDDYIKYEQAITVICRITSLYAGKDYPAGYISAAIDSGICDRIDALIGNEITGNQCADLVFNAMEYMYDNNVKPYVKNVSDSDSEEFLSDSYKMSPAMSGGGGGGSRGMASMSMASSSMPYVPYPTENFNTEEYTSNEENVFKDVFTSPLSTFSIDADTASYSNLRRFIMQKSDIPSGSVRTEELINYFDYDDASVKPGEVFGVKTEVGICPWNTQNKLAMITVNGEELNEYKPSNIVFLIDTSGSMYDSNKLPLVKKALAMLLEKLGSEDKISVVTYASGTRVALEPTPASEKAKILGVIESLYAGGATAGASGINLAYEQAEKAKIDGNNRVILCTDGDFNVGISSTGDLEKLIETKRESGIFLSVLGFGMGNYKDNRMETLADKGNGNYAYIDNLREAKKVLVDDMSKTIYTIAKDVKIQVEFNPEKIKSYRLVGYENRLLNNEDFANDAKDAGELGAGSTVTVFYEIVPADGSEKANLKYQNVTSAGSGELMTVKIRYKLPQGEESMLREYPVEDKLTEETSIDFKFAAAVAELGMILNESEYKGSSTLDSVIELARLGRGEDKFGLRSEFVQLVDLYRYCK